MAKKISNDRCPFRDECERKCVFQGKELDCDYYSANAMPGFEIPDQEQRREEQFRQQEEKALGQTSGREEPKTKDPVDKVEITALGQTSGQTNGVSFLSGPNGVTEKIKLAMYRSAREFVYIGFLLWEAQQNGYYLEGGYKDVYEYAERELNLKRSSTKNFIAIATQFGSNKSTHTMFLQPEYEEFNYSQLCEMLAMSPSQREQVRPNMTVRELREIKKQPEPDLPPDMETIPLELPEDVGQTSGREAVATVVINGLVVNDLSTALVKQLVKLAGLQYDPQLCFNITIE